MECPNLALLDVCCNNSGQTVHKNQRGKWFEFPEEEILENSVWLFVLQCCGRNECWWFEASQRVELRELEKRILDAMTAVEAMAPHSRAHPFHSNKCCLLFRLGRPRLAG
jgi:hypothetical protein